MLRPVERFAVSLEAYSSPSHRGPAHGSLRRTLILFVLCGVVMGLLLPEPTVQTAARDILRIAPAAGP